MKVLESAGTAADLAEPHRVPDLGGWLGRVRLGELSSCRGLDLWPVLLEGNGVVPYLLLQDALASRRIEIVESGGGTVNEVRAVSRADMPVLILEGDTLIGAKQNRLVVRSVLVPAGKTVPLHVGCMERGRWSRAAGGFRVGCVAAEPTLRAATLSGVHRAVRAGHAPKPDQAVLWLMVASKLESHRVASPTSDYHARLTDAAPKFEREAQAIAPAPGQVGVLALWRAYLMGFELVGHPDTWRAVARRWLPSYLLAAEMAELDATSRPATKGRKAEDWLEAIRQARVESAPAVGLGENLSLEGDGLLGAGLWHDGGIAHLAGFSF